jgi:hypothetical protein
MRSNRPTTSMKTRWLLLAAFLATVGSGAGLAAELEVELTVLTVLSADAPTEITLLAEPIGGETAYVVRRAEEYAIGPGRWVIDIPAGRWRLRADLPGYWSERVEIDDSAPGQATGLRLWPAGVLRGRLDAAGEILPRTVELHFEGDAYSWETAEPPTGTVSCPVVREIWRCEVPVGRLNLILAPGRFVPHARWEVDVDPDEARDLGTFELELGGALRGRVELDDGTLPSSECEVRLTTPRGAREDAAEGLPAAPVAEDGSFEFPAIPAREYVLTASQPGYQDASSPPVTVLRGESVELEESLLLYRPVALELVFSPPAAPGGRGWKFALHRLDPEGDRKTQIARAESDPNGIWVKEDLAPGLYEVSLAEKIGSALPPQQVELAGGRTTLPIELPVLLLEGEVLAGGEPLAARVTLSRPAEKLRATFESDDTGSFSGLLPSEGLWQVRVDSPAENMRLSLDPIEIFAQGASGVAVVEIRLPDTVIEGEVTDLRGDPQANASVRIQRRGPVTGSHSVKTGVRAV